MKATLKYGPYTYNDFVSIVNSRVAVISGFRFHFMAAVWNHYLQSLFPLPYLIRIRPSSVPCSALKALYQASKIQCWYFVWTGKSRRKALLASPAVTRKQDRVQTK
jgi:hypothetical protein